MNVLKIAKYQSLEALKPILVFYSIFIVIILFLSAGNATSNGIEFSTAIFVLVAGLNSFKSQFYLAQANNVSRKSFVKGSLLGMLPITFGMSLIDLIINRVLNIFGRCPTFFDMIYGNYRDFLNSDINVAWTQPNDFKTLFGTLIWQFAVYSVISIFGILISLSYYKSNSLMKVFITVFSIAFLSSSYTINMIIIDTFGINIGQFLTSIFGWQSRNPYVALLSLAVIGTALSMIIYLFTKKAVIKE